MTKSARPVIAKAIGVGAAQNQSRARSTKPMNASGSAHA